MYPKETGEYSVSGALEKMAADLKGPVTLLHVMDTEHSALHLSRQALEELRETNREQLEDLRKHLEKAGGRATVELVEGSPRKVILERVAKGDFSLIAMGTQGKGFFREAFLGSLANEVARQAELPVLFFPWQD
jgi:nucleotide-binding universal stress UspA family protein